MDYYVDTAQKENLIIIKKELKAGKLREVCDTPKWWIKYTTVEIAYILKYWSK